MKTPSQSTHSLYNSTSSHSSPLSLLMASVSRAVICQLRSQRKPTPAARVVVADSLSLPKSLPPPDQVKVVLQPRLCTLRTYGSDRSGVIRTKVGDGGQLEELSPFLANLYEYIESSKRSQDFETISGRLAMIIFAVTVGVELTTGNSVFRKMDLQGIEEAAGVCVGAVACAALFAWSSSARTRVGRIFTTGCNTFIDALIDNIVDRLFFDSDPSDWSDEI